jgi:molybdopterin molybdotransferase
VGRGGARPRHRPRRHGRDAPALRRAEGADVLVTTGGASVGEHDLVRQALVAEGYKLGFWKIAMRPGKPLMFATPRPSRALGLPGNPVSAIVCARVFLKPLLAALLGIEPAETGVQARLAEALPANDRRQDYLRARLERAPDGTLTATAFAVQDSSMQRTLAMADGLIVRPPFDPAAKSRRHGHGLALPLRLLTPHPEKGRQARLEGFTPAIKPCRT